MGICSTTAEGTAGKFESSETLGECSKEDDDIDALPLPVRDRVVAECLSTGLSSHASSGWRDQG